MLNSRNTYAVQLLCFLLTFLSVSTFSTLASAEGHDNSSLKSETSHHHQDRQDNLTLLTFDIQPMSADKALIAFGQQANKTVIFSYELTKEFKANKVKGHYPPAYALKKLLLNTGLSATLDQAGQIHVAKTLEVNKNSHQPNEKTAESRKDKQTIEAISIIGSRVLGRSIDDLPVPVDIISSDRIKLSGEANLGKSLQVIAPSFNFPSSAISDGTDVLTPATLRGLGPDQTLVLINGRRRHQAALIHINTSVGRGTAGTDITAIPQNAIKRIEILRDGAASQYGSDAIAGVINIVLKDKPTDDSLALTYGQYSQGDGENIQFEANKGFLFSNGISLHSSLFLTDRESTNRAGLDGSCIYQGCTQIAPEAQGDIPIYQTDNPKELAASRDTFSIGSPSSQQVALVVNGEYPLSESEQIYGFATLSKRDNSSSAFFRNANNPSSNIILHDGEAFYPDGFLPNIETEIEDQSYNLGYKKQLMADSFIDFSYTFGKNTIDYQTTNSVNPSYVNNQLHNTNLSAEKIRLSTPTSAYAYGLALSLQTLNIDYQKTFSLATMSLGTELRHDRYQVFSGESYSYDDYDSDLITNIDTNIDGNAGIEGFGGINSASSVDQTRKVSSLYLDIESNVTESLSLGSALRFDHYENFGSTNNVKLTALWQPIDNWSIRSAFSTGFRAPSMQQLFTSSVSTQFVNSSNELNENDSQTYQNQTAKKVGTFGSNTDIGEQIGLPKLKEEKSKNYSLGSTYQLSDYLSFSLDFYSTYIKNRILFSKLISCDETSQLNEILATVGADSAQFFINGADTKTRGIDIITTWQQALFSGQLDLTLAANYSSTKVDRIFTPAIPLLNKSATDSLIDQRDISIIEQWQPENKIHLNALYHWQKWLINLSVNRYGSYTIIDGGKQTYSPKAVTNLKISYQLSPSITVNLGGNNIFDVMPDKNTIGNAHAGKIIDGDNNTLVESSGVFTYSRRSAPFGFNGAYFYAGLRYNF